MDDMADEVSADTFPYTLNGRELVFKSVQHGQIIMLERYVDALRVQADKLIEAKDADGVLVIGKKISNAVWTSVESQFTSPDDLEWVQMEIIAGRLTEHDLVPLMSNGIKRVTVEDDADPAPAKRPGRKAPAKKAARKAATPRAKR